MPCVHLPFCSHLYPVTTSESISNGSSTISIIIFTHPALRLALTSTAPPGRGTGERRGADSGSFHGALQWMGFMILGASSWQWGDPCLFLEVPSPLHGCPPSDPLPSGSPPVLAEGHCPGRWHQHLPASTSWEKLAFWRKLNPICNFSNSAHSSEGICEGLLLPMVNSILTEIQISNVRVNEVL